MSSKQIFAETKFQELYISIISCHEHSNTECAWEFVVVSDCWESDHVGTVIWSLFSYVCLFCSKPLGVYLTLGGDLPLQIPIAVDYQLGVCGIGDCMMRGSARASSMPSTKRYSWIGRGLDAHIKSIFQATVMAIFDSKIPTKSSQ